MHKLNSLTVGETKALLHRYFGKVIDLKENDRKKDLLCSELEVPQLSVKTCIRFVIATFTSTCYGFSVQLTCFFLYVTILRCNIFIVLFQMKVEELETVIKELETSLHRSTMESDRKMTHQQQEYEKKIQVLMRQLSETATGFAAGDGMVNGNSTSGEKDAKYVSDSKSKVM